MGEGDMEIIDIERELLRIQDLARENSPESYQKITSIIRMLTTGYDQNLKEDLLARIYMILLFNSHTLEEGFEKIMRTAVVLSDRTALDIAVDLISKTKNGRQFLVEFANRPSYVSEVIKNYIEKEQITSDEDEERTKKTRDREVNIDLTSIIKHVDNPHLINNLLNLNDRYFKMYAKDLIKAYVNKHPNELIWIIFNRMTPQEGLGLIRDTVGPSKTILFIHDNKKQLQLYMNEELIDTYERQLLDLITEDDIAGLNEYEISRMIEISMNYDRTDCLIRILKHGNDRILDSVKNKINRKLLTKIVSYDNLSTFDKYELLSKLVDEKDAVIVLLENDPNTIGDVISGKIELRDEVIGEVLVKTLDRFMELNRDTQEVLLKKVGVKPVLFSLLDKEEIGKVLYHMNQLGVIEEAVSILIYKGFNVIPYLTEIVGDERTYEILNRIQTKDINRLLQEHKKNEIDRERMRSTIDVLRKRLGDELLVRLLIDSNLTDWFDVVYEEYKKENKLSNLLDLGERLGERYLFWISRFLVQHGNKEVVISHKGIEKIVLSLVKSNLIDVEDIPIPVIIRARNPELIKRSVLANPTKWITEFGYGQVARLTEKLKITDQVLDRLLSENRFGLIRYVSRVIPPESLAILLIKNKHYYSGIKLLEKMGKRDDVISFIISHLYTPEQTFDILVRVWSIERTISAMYRYPRVVLDKIKKMDYSDIDVYTMLEGTLGISNIYDKLDESGKKMVIGILLNVKGIGEVLRFAKERDAYDILIRTVFEKGELTLLNRISGSVPPSKIVEVIQDSYDYLRLYYGWSVKRYGVKRTLEHVKHLPVSQLIDMAINTDVGVATVVNYCLSKDLEGTIQHLLTSRSINLDKMFDILINRENKHIINTIQVLSEKRGVVEVYDAVKKRLGNKQAIKLFKYSDLLPKLLQHSKGKTLSLTKDMIDTFGSRETTQLLLRSLGYDDVLHIALKLNGAKREGEKYYSYKILKELSSNRYSEITGGTSEMIKKIVGLIGLESIKHHKGVACFIDYKMKEYLRSKPHRLHEVLEPILPEYSKVIKLLISIKDKQPRVLESAASIIINRMKSGREYANGLYIMMDNCSVKEIMKAFSSLPDKEMSNKDFMIIYRVFNALYEQRVSYHARRDVVFPRPKLSRARATA